MKGLTEKRRSDVPIFAERETICARDSGIVHKPKSHKCEY
jgi:hypothetical protein